MKEIKLFKTRKKFQVDDEDYEACLPYKWLLIKSTTTNYVRRTIKVDGVQYSQPLHQFLVGEAPFGCVTDHVDGNGLNNQRSVNIRFATHSQNMQNTHKSRNKETHPGVRKDKKGIFFIIIDGKVVFKSGIELECAIRYEELCIERFGEFAKTKLIENPFKPTCNLPFIGYTPTRIKSYNERQEMRVNLITIREYEKALIPTKKEAKIKRLKTRAMEIEQMYGSLSLNAERSSLCVFNTISDAGTPNKKSSNADTPPLRYEMKQQTHATYDKEKLIAWYKAHNKTIKI